MRLAWNEVCEGLGFVARALVIGTTVTLACSGGDEFTSAAGGSSGTTSGGGSGRGGTAGSAGTDGNGGTAGSGGAGGSTGGSNGSGGRSGTGGGGTAGSSGADGGGTAGTSGSAGSATGGTAGTATGGTSGSSGSDGSGGTGGSAGTGGAINCRWNDAGACPTGQYCNALGCNNGTCMPLPAEGSTKNPVCGCDGITYWNPSVAGHRSMSVKSTGECAPARTCGGIGSIQCPGNDMACNMKVLTSPMCLTADLGGACWVMPNVCPSGPGFGPNTRACGAGACKAECELIKSGEPWYVDGTCPQ